MTRRTVTLAALLVVLGLVAAVVLGVTDVLDRDVRLSTTQSLPLLSAPGGGDAPGGGAGRDVGGGDAEDGDLDEPVSVHSDAAAVTRLDPALLAALRAAARQAGDDGIEVRISSGWRSKDYQQRLLDEAVVRYGSLEEALRWVASPDSSAHITGHAVDVSPTDAAYWMGEHGSAFGLCQTYANEIWHYEVLTSPGGTCPAPLADGAS